MNSEAIEETYLKRQISALVGTYGKSTTGIYIIVQAVEGILGGEVRVGGKPYHKRNIYQRLWEKEGERELRHKASKDGSCTSS